MIVTPEILVITSLAFNFVYFCVVFYLLRYQYLVLRDNADAFKILVEFINKNFGKNLEDHENIIKIVTENDEKIVQSLTENDQKIVDLVSENQKNLMNLAVFLGYRQRNLDDL